MLTVSSLCAGEAPLNPIVGAAVPTSEDPLPRSSSWVQNRGSEGRLITPGPGQKEKLQTMQNKESDPIFIWSGGETAGGGATLHQPTGSCIGPCHVWLKEGACWGPRLPWIPKYPCTVHPGMGEGRGQDPRRT